MNFEKLPWPPIGADYKEYKLPSSLYIEQWILPEGMTVKLRQTRDFGWLVLPQRPIDERGFEIPKRLFRY